MVQYCFNACVNNMELNKHYSTKVYIKYIRQMYFSSFKIDA